MFRHSPATGISVAVVGAGGNIGSHLVPHLARIDSIAHVLLVDPERYTKANLRTQHFAADEVDQPKAEVQAQRLRRLNPGLSVKPLVSEIENVPWGRLSVDVLLSCVDSRATRLYLNLVACRLELGWIDAGVGGSADLVRATTLAPHEERACFECSWDERDYAALEPRYSCSRDSEVLSTAAVSTSSLGAVAAGMQIFELNRLLVDPEAPGTELILDLTSGNSFRSKLDANPHCRLSHHVISHERSHRSPQELSPLGALTELGDLEDPADPEAWLRLERSWFVTRLACPGCGSAENVFRVASSIKESDQLCRGCDVHMVPVGTDRVDASLARASACRSLAEAGVLSGDIVTIFRGQEERHYELL